MAERASYIKLAVENGVTDLSQIRDTYNKYAEGGDFSAGAMTDALYKSAEEVESLGYPAHNYDFTQSEEWANAHGYYPDERGHRDDRVNKFDDGGDRLISTGNEYADIGLSFVPFVSSAMDIEEAIRNPTFGNIAFATGSVIADFFGGSLIKGAIKGGIKAARATKAIERAEKATEAYNRAVHNVTVNPTRGTRKQVRRTFQEAQAAKAELRTLTRVGKKRSVRRAPSKQLIIPSDNTKIINPYTVYGTDFIINAIQQGGD